MKRKDFDGEACIRLLLDKSQDPGVREDAADSLMWSYAKPQACQAMLKVILDASEDSDLREGTAECLGNLWSEMDYDQKDLDSIPEPFKTALLNEMELRKKTKQ